jgi:sulfite reductase (NADPH) flavoprotein alpha-component
MDGVDAPAVRTLAAALVIAAYLALCAAVLRRWRRRHAQPEEGPGAPAAANAGEPLLVAYASQTGFAEELARHAARTLQGAGIPARVLALSALTADLLRRARHALFVVSTCGEGEPPDNAVLFMRRLMGAELALPGLHYGVLALGDRSYANFCGFGRSLDDWLRRHGAKALFERIDVDRGNETALHGWSRHVARLAGAAEPLPAPSADPFEDWQLAVRHHLNPGSAGGPVFHVELVPADGRALPAWQAGDLVQVLAPGDTQRPRDYSIASVPADARIHLLVRQERHADGSLGLASGWLTQHAAPGDTVRLRLRANRGFRLGSNNARPLILIGNGTGLAGLRSHLRARAGVDGARHWLLFGERHSAHDFHHREEIEAWHQQGTIERLDMVFSRDQPQRRHVQHALTDAAGTLRAWLDAGAAIYVCGSREGMAAGVDAALRDIVGAQAVDGLLREGRYRRDVY